MASDLFGLDISLGMISKLEHRAAEVLEPVVAEMAAAVVAAPSAHIDETSWTEANPFSFDNAERLAVNEKGIVRRAVGCLEFGDSVLAPLTCRSGQVERHDGPSRILQKRIDALAPSAVLGFLWKGGHNLVNQESKPVELILELCRTANGLSTNNSSLLEI